MAIEDELRHDIADVLDQFGFNISKGKLYSDSAEMNAEIVKATESIMQSVAASNQRAAQKAQIEARLDELHRNYGKWQIDRYNPKHYYPKRVAELEAALAAAQPRKDGDE